LNQGGNPVGGGYDLQFAVYDAVTNGNQIEPLLTDSATAVSNGLFTVTLDFGGVFNGSNFWLQIGVRTNGGGVFTPLNPRQPFTPAPYAIMAASASNLLGTLPASQLTGPVSLANLPANFTNTLATTNLLSTVQFALNVANLGVTNDGVTDVTARLQALLNQGGAFFFPPGRYLAQELHLTNNTTLFGSGAVLVYADNPANTNIFVSCGLNTNISIIGLSFEGGDYSDITRRTFTTAAGAQNFSDPSLFAYWNPLGLRQGLQFNTEAGGVITGVTIYGFSGIGLLPVSITGVNGASTLKTIVTGINCFSNLCGFFPSGMIGPSPFVANWINNYVPGGKDPEFMFYSGLNLFHNTVGMSASAGNCTFINSVISGNYFGQVDVNGNNEHHGSINSILYTHNTVCGIYIAGSVNGEQIINCQFRDNGAPFTLDTDTGITIDFCTFQPVNFTNRNTVTANYFRHNTYAGAWAAAGLSTDNKLVYFGNTSYDTAGDNDGQILTSLQSGTIHGLSTNLQFTFNSTRTNTLYFTNGVLTNVTQP
jgi:hypothetical protein